MRKKRQLIVGMRLVKIKITYYIRSKREENEQF